MLNLLQKSLAKCTNSRKSTVILYDNDIKVINIAVVKYILQIKYMYNRRWILNNYLCTECAIKLTTLHLLIQKKEMYLTFLTIIRAQWTVPQLSIMIIYNCIWSNLIQ